MAASKLAATTLTVRSLPSETMFDVGVQAVGLVAHENSDISELIGVSTGKLISNSAVVSAHPPLLPSVTVAAALFLLVAAL